MPITAFLALLTMSLLLRCGNGEETAVNNEPPDILVLLSDLLQELKGFRADMQMTANRIPSDCKSSLLLHDDGIHPAPQIVKTDDESHTEENNASEKPLHTEVTEPPSLWCSALGVRNLHHAVQVTGKMLLTAFAGMFILGVLVRFVWMINAIRNTEERAILIGLLVGIPIGFLLLFNICSRYVFT